MSETLNVPADPFEAAMEAQMSDTPQSTPIPEDGADLKETPAEETYQSQLSFTDDESFAAIKPEDEPQPTVRDDEYPEPANVYTDEISEAEHAQRVTESLRSVQRMNIATAHAVHYYDVPTDGFSRKVGLASNAAIMKRANTTQDLGWDVTLHLPESVTGSAIDDLRNGALRIIIIPENTGSTVISEAVTAIVEAMMVKQANR